MPYYLLFRGEIFRQHFEYVRVVLMILIQKNREWIKPQLGRARTVPQPGFLQAVFRTPLQVPHPGRQL